VKLLGYTLLLGLAGFSGGFFYGRSEPEIVYWKSDQVTYEVRDNYWRKCKFTSAVAHANGTVEENVTCPKIKIFLVKKKMVRLAPVRDSQSLLTTGLVGPASVSR